METAKLLRRTVGRLSQEVAKSPQRISVNAMLDLSHQIKRSILGTVVYVSLLDPFCTYCHIEFVIMLALYIKSNQISIVLPSTALYALIYCIKYVHQLNEAVGC
jgi:hypothetical protein